MRLMRYKYCLKRCGSTGYLMWVAWSGIGQSRTTACTILQDSLRGQGLDEDLLWFVGLSDGGFDQRPTVDTFVTTSCSPRIGSNF